KRFLDTSNLRVMVAAESPGRRETMAGYFSEYGLKPGLCRDFQEFQSGDRSFVLAVSPLASGFVVPAEGWAIVTEAELYAGLVRHRARKGETRSSIEGMLRDLSELKVAQHPLDRKSTRLNSSHLGISYAVFCLKKKKR